MTPRGRARFELLSVEPTDQMVEHPIFSVPGQMMRINGAEAHLFVYENLSDRQEDWAKISADRRIVAGIPVPDEVLVTFRQGPQELR